MLTKESRTYQLAKAALLAVLIALTPVNGDLRAQTKKPQPAAEKKEDPLSILYKDAVKSFEEKKYREALAQFEELDTKAVDGFVASIPHWQTGGMVGGAPLGARSAADDITVMGRAARESAKAIAEERKQRVEALQQRRSDLASTVSGGFLSELFGEVNPWAPGADFMSILRSDRADIAGFNRALHRVRGKGVTGPAFAELAQSGNLAAASQLAAMSRADLHRYELAFNRRAREARELGRYAGQAAYGGASDRHLADLNHHAKETNRRLASLERAVTTAAPEKTGQAVGRELNKVAASAARRSR